MHSFGQRLTEARKAKGMTQEQLAEKLNVSRQTVSHWENERMNPEADAMERLCTLLDIDPTAAEEKGEATPAKHHTIKVNPIIAFISGILLTLLVVYGVVPLFSEPAIPASVTTIDELTEDQALQPANYPKEWYQQPAMNEEGKAYIKFEIGETPVKLYKTRDRNHEYEWRILFGFEETNGVSLTVNKLTHVYFNSDDSIASTSVLTGDECERYWENQTIEANTYHNFNTDPPASSANGYGFALEGVDANGNELAFGFYVPLSSELSETFQPEQFQTKAVQEEGKAFINVWPSEDTVPLTLQSETDGDFGWFVEFSMENQADIAFAPSRVVIAFFDDDYMVDAFKYDSASIDDIQGIDSLKEKGNLIQWGAGTYQQALTGMGCMVEGVDANGNELCFAAYANLSQEISD